MAVGFAGSAIGRDALVFGMSDILSKDRLKCLDYDRYRCWFQRVALSVVNVDVGHLSPTRGVLLE